MSDLNYAAEKFWSAIGSLAGNGPIKQRLESAFLHFHPIKPDDFANAETRKDYEDLMRRLTVVKDDAKGHVPSTIAAMTEEQAENVTGLIVSLCHSIEWGSPRGSEASRYGRACELGHPLWRIRTLAV